MKPGNTVIILDESGNAVDVNLTMQPLFNADAIIGQKPDNFFSDYPSLLQLYHELRASSDQSMTHEVRLEITGTEYYIDVYVDELQNGGAVITLTDITTQRQADLLAFRHYAELTALRTIDERISSTLDINDVLEIALTYALDMSGADAGFISLIEDGQHHRVVCVAGKYPNTYLDRLFPLDEGIFGRVLDRCEPELIPAVRDDPDYIPVIPDTRAQMVIPLIAYDKLTGLLSLETRGSNTFNPSTFDFACILAKRFAMAIDNAQLYTATENHLQELKQLYDQVSTLEQEKTQIIRIAAHNLRGPIGTIMGYLDLMQIDQERVDPEHREWVDTMKGLTQRVDDLITDILSLERAHQGVLQEKADLNELTVNIVRNYEAEARLKSLKIKLDIPEKPLIVQGDSVQLREAISNLVSNAVKYTPTGGQINISLRLENEAVIFAVQDTGYGIPEDLQDRLFEPFYRAVSAETRTIEGTGLGLHLVKNIVERHNGEIRFESIHGQGSTFGFALPYNP